MTKNSQKEDYRIVKNFNLKCPKTHLTDKRVPNKQFIINPDHYLESNNYDTWNDFGEIQILIKP